MEPHRLGLHQGESTRHAQLSLQLVLSAWGLGVRRARPRAMASHSVTPGGRGWGHGVAGPVGWG